MCRKFETEEEKVLLHLYFDISGSVIVISLYDLTHHFQIASKINVVFLILLQCYIYFGITLYNYPNVLISRTRFCRSTQLH